MATGLWGEANWSSTAQRKSSAASLRQLNSRLCSFLLYEIPTAKLINVFRSPACMRCTTSGLKIKSRPEDVLGGFFDMQLFSF
jgi:hypothetical protein